MLGHDPTVDHRAGLHWKRAPGTTIIHLIPQTQDAREIASHFGPEMASLSSQRDIAHELGDLSRPEAPWSGSSGSFHQEAR